MNRSDNSIRKFLIRNGIDPKTIRIKTIKEKHEPSYKHLTAEIIAQIMQHIENKMKTSEICKLFNISKFRVNRLKRGQTYQ